MTTKVAASLETNRRQVVSEIKKLFLDRSFLQRISTTSKAAILKAKLDGFKWGGGKKKDKHRCNPQFKNEAWFRLELLNHWRSASGELALPEIWTVDILKGVKLQKSAVGRESFAGAVGIQLKFYIASGRRVTQNNIEGAIHDMVNGAAFRSKKSIEELVPAVGVVILDKPYVLQRKEGNPISVVDLLRSAAQSADLSPQIDDLGAAPHEWTLFTWTREMGLSDGRIKTTCRQGVQDAFAREYKIGESEAMKLAKIYMPT